MKFPDEQTHEVKKWVIGRIENISDADPDVLAEYVLAILKSDVPDAEIRAQMLEHLPDFLNEHTPRFVDEVFAKYATAPDSPGYSPPTSPIPIKPYQSPNTLQQVGPDGFSAKPTRKRSHHDSTSQTQEAVGSARPSKSSRLGKGTRERNTLSRSQYSQPAFQPAAFHTQAFSNFPRPPTPPPGFPAFNPVDPVSSFMAMQAMFPHMTSTSSTLTKNASAATRKRRRCQDYDTKGYCVRGSACHFDHGNDHIVASVDDEYDPTNAIIDTNSNLYGLSSLQLGPSNGKTDFRKPARAAFSDHRLPKDRSLTAIVVEQIPEDYFDEQAVQNFFSQFGKITDITMKAYKHLAIVKYETRDAAQRAWESPKVIFENRFVKVYWYQPDLDAKAKSNGTISHARSPSDVNLGGLSDLTAVEDVEAYKRRQDEKQQAHEQRQAALRKMEEAKQALIRRKDFVATTYEAERAILKAKLDAKGEELPVNGDKEVSAEALALRKQLARLEAEAEALGIDPKVPAEEPAEEAYKKASYDYRGRGSGHGYSSRGGFSRRGRGYIPYQPTRGSYRGSPFVRGRSSAVRKLDNRPRKIAISGIDFNAQKEEMLRAYLVSVGEFESIERDADKSDCFTVSFKERWQAEQVMNGQMDAPGVGKMKLSWVASAPMTTTEQPVVMDQDDEVVGDAPNGKSHDMQDDRHDELEVNLDVAGGEDDWDDIA